MERKQRRKLENKKKKRTTLAVFLFIFASAGITYTMLFSPIFNITDIFAVGMDKLSEDEIVGASGALIGDNVFRTRINLIKQQVAKLPYVDEVNVRRIFPNKLKIWVRESIPKAVIAKDNLFIAIDEHGKALEITDSRDRWQIPVIHGVIISDSTPGSIVTVDNNDNYIFGINLLNEIIKNDILTDIISIDVTDLSNLYLNYQNRISVILGTNDLLVYKMKFFNNIIASDEISGTRQGILDLSVSEPYFRQTD